MAKLTGRDKTVCDEINAVLAKHGYKTTRYFVSQGQADARITINVDDVQAMKGETKYALDYKRWCKMEGFEPEWLGTEFTYNGKQVKLEGFHLKRRGDTKAVFSRDGKLFIARLPDAKTALAKKAA